MKSINKLMLIIVLSPCSLWHYVSIDAMAHPVIAQEDEETAAQNIDTAEYRRLADQRFRTLYQCSRASQLISRFAGYFSDPNMKQSFNDLFKTYNDFEIPKLIKNTITLSDDLIAYDFLVDLSCFLERQKSRKGSKPVQQPAVSIEELKRTFETERIADCYHIISYPEPSQESSAETISVAIPRELIDSGLFPSLKAVLPQYEKKTQNKLYVPGHYTKRTLVVLKTLLWIIYTCNRLEPLSNAQDQRARINKELDYFFDTEDEETRQALHNGILELAYHYDLKEIMHALMYCLSKEAYMVQGNNKELQEYLKGLDISLELLPSLLGDPRSEALLSRILTQKLASVGDQDTSTYHADIKEQCLKRFERDIYHILEIERMRGSQTLFALTPELEKQFKKRLIEKHAIPNFAPVIRFKLNKQEAQDANADHAPAASSMPTRARLYNKDPFPKQNDDDVLFWYPNGMIKSANRVEGYAVGCNLPSLKLEHGSLIDTFVLRSGNSIRLFDTNAIWLIDKLPPLAELQAHPNRNTPMREIQKPSLNSQNTLVDAFELTNTPDRMVVAYKSGEITMHGIYSDFRLQITLPTSAAGVHNEVTALCEVTGDKNMLAVGTKDNGIYLVNYDSTCVATLRDEYNISAVTALTQYNNCYLLAGYANGDVLVWDLEKQKVSKRILSAHGARNRNPFTPVIGIWTIGDGGIIEIACADGYLFRTFIPKIATLKQILNRLKLIDLPGGMLND